METLCLGSDKQTLCASEVKQHTHTYIQRIAMYRRRIPPFFAWFWITFGFCSDKTLWSISPVTPGGQNLYMTSYMNWFHLLQPEKNFAWTPFVQTSRFSGNIEYYGSFLQHLLYFMHAVKHFTRYTADHSSVYKYREISQSAAHIPFQEDGIIH